MASIIGNSSKVSFVNKTPNAEETMAHIARVSSKNQDNPEIEKLLRYCIKHGHWSVFEQATMTVEVICPLAVAVQLIRHRSFCFQHFSGRYQDQREMGKVVEGIGNQSGIQNPSVSSTIYKNLFYIPIQPRLQDKKNRQNSLEVEDSFLKKKMHNEMAAAYDRCLESYNNLLNLGIAKEVARFVLPQGVMTRLYVTGTVRSFIHYCNVRDEEGVVQHEHVEVAQGIKEIMEDEFPVVSKALEWV